MVFLVRTKWKFSQTKCNLISKIVCLLCCLDWSVWCVLFTRIKKIHMQPWSYFYFIYQLSVLTDKTDFGKKYLLFYSSSTQLSCLIFHAEAATVKFKYIHNHNLETKSISSSLLVMKLWLLMSWSYFLLEHEAYSLHSTKSILEPREEFYISKMEIKLKWMNNILSRQKLSK